MKMQFVQKTSLVILNIVAWQLASWAQTNVLPRPFEVYGGSIGVIDAIQVAGANKTRVFATTDSQNSVFYADVDYSSADPLGTNFVFTVVPDMDANANYGAPAWLAAHQQSGRIFVGTSSGLLSCATSAGSLTTPVSEPISFVLIQDSRLFAVNYPSLPETPKSLYYGSLDSSGNLTLGAPLAGSFTGSTVRAAINPTNSKVYVLCSQSSGFVLYKSSDNYDAFSAATTFSVVPSAGVTVQEVGQLSFGPDGRLFLGGGNGMNLQVAWSDTEGGAWTNIDTGGNRAGVGSGLNIACNGSSNAYEVYFGTAVSSNKGVVGSWSQFPRGGCHPPATHVNAGSTKVDPLCSNVIYLTTDKGIGGSTNAGVDVIELNAGLLAFQINSIDALSSKTVAWLGSKAGMRRAANFDTSPVWTDGDFPDAIVYSVAIDPDDLTGMTGYAGSCRLYRTTTGGGTNAGSWNQVFRWEDYPLTDGEIRSVKAKGGYVALGYYSYAQNNPSGAVYVSTDNGSHWTAALANVDVNDLLYRDESGVSVVYAAVAKSKTGDRGGIYRIAASSAAMDMTNEVNIQDMAEDSNGGIYASGTLPDGSDPSRHNIVAYYRDTNSTWSMLTTNGLPGNLWEGSVLGSGGVGPVITVGKDSATNDVPVLAVMRTIYYLPYGGADWVTVTNYPNGTRIKTLFWDELMVGTTIGLYGQGINAHPEPEPAASAIALAADFDGDGKADPAVYNTNGNWKIRISSNPAYPLVSLPAFLGGSGFVPLAADFDGDKFADPAVYHAEFEFWEVKLSSAHYLVPVDIFSFGGSGWEALAGDFDGDAKADPALYQASTGTWKIRLSSADYLTITKAGFMGWTGWQAMASDFDGDGKVDPAIYQASTGSWIVMLSRSDYRLAVLDPHFLGGSGYTGMAADFDGDGYADPTVAEVLTGHWQIKLSSGKYCLVDLPDFLGE